jgi:hypothetical protein
MRIIAAFLCLVMDISAARADGPMDFKKARTLQRVGMALTFTAAATFVASYIAGFIWLLETDRPICVDPPCGNVTPTAHPNEIIAASLLAAAGVAQLGAGIPLMAIGCRREKASRATVSVSLTPTGIAGTF